MAVMSAAQCQANGDMNPHIAGSDCELAANSEPLLSFYAYHLTAFLRTCLFAKFLNS